MSDPVQFDYLCCAEFDGESKSVLFVLTRPEGWNPENMTPGEAALLFQQQWTKKRPCPGGRLHVGLPADSTERLRAAVLECRCYVFRIDAVRFWTSVKPN